MAPSLPSLVLQTYLLRRVVGVSVSLNITFVQSVFKKVRMYTYFKVLRPFFVKYVTKDIRTYFTLER